MVAIDVDAPRLERISDYGASLTVNASDMDARGVKKTVKTWVKENGLARIEWKIFETSGTPAGQETAFALLNHGAYLSIVGFTPKPVTVRLKRDEPVDKETIRALDKLVR